MNAMKNKIKSQRGASITFALLLFLVCAVVSIVVVVAGSAAAGRMSQRAEADQRYYAVTSAVELLCNDFKGMKVKVEYSKKPSDTSVPKNAITVRKIFSENDPLEQDVKENYAVLAEASSQLVSMIANSSDTLDDIMLNLTATSGPTGAALDCTIKERIKKDGRVIFEVSNANMAGATKQNTYTLQVTFEANISQSSSQYMNGDKTMEKVTTTLVWSVNSIKKGTL